ncbi:MAG TPA: protease inhibitor Inh/omp19 family protein [Methylomirabilota bacterium]|nr:protease inhibitor Inh/omp19 family protein [Methylomirabilota bacterium]
MRLNLIAGVALALTLAACGSRGSYYPDTRISPLQPQPIGPVSAQPLPPPELTPIETPAVDVAAAPPVTDPSAALEIRRPDLSGGWTIASGGESCQLFMSLTTWSGGYRANTRGCSTDQLKSVGAWDLNGKEIVLKDASGAAIARLYASTPTRFSGQSTSGQGVQVFR